MVPLRSIALAFTAAVSIILLLPAAPLIAQTCSLNGTAPICAGSCPGGAQQIQRIDEGCTTGSRAYCCDFHFSKAPRVTPVFCAMFGTGPICAGRCPAGWTRKSSNSSGCISGTRVNCCDEREYCLVNGRRVVCTTPAPKDDRPSAICRAYANEAVFALQQARTYCLPGSFTGPRWTDNADAHARWCMGVTPTVRDRESDARARFLAQCGRAKECRAYAHEAVNQVTVARGRCARSLITGPRWTLNADAHFQWCMNSRSGEANSESMARMQVIAGCKGVHAVPGTANIHVMRLGSSFLVNASGFLPNTPVVIVVSGPGAKSGRIAVSESGRIMANANGRLSVRLGAAAVCNASGGTVMFGAEDQDRLRRTAFPATSSCAPAGKR